MARQFWIWRSLPSDTGLPTLIQRLNELLGGKLAPKINDLGERVLSGGGDPEGVVSAQIGSIYLRTDGGTGTTLYVKETSPTPNTGWVSK